MPRKEAKPRLFKSRLMSVYNNDKESNVAFCKGHSGVYMIYHKDGKLVYVGFSGTNLYKTVLRHFQSWDDNTQVRVSYRNKLDYKVRVIFATPARAEKLERALIVKYKPSDNPNKLRRYIPTKTETEILEELENANAVPAAIMEDAPF